jgi:hypothetical protein
MFETKDRERLAARGGARVPGGCAAATETLSRSQSRRRTAVLSSFTALVAFIRNGGCGRVADYEALRYQMHEPNG